MRALKSSDYVVIPKGVTVTCKNRVVTVKGPRGELKREFKHISCELDVVEDRFLVTMWLAKRKQIAAIRTTCAHVANMIKGVTEGFRYKLRFAYAHFPVNVTVEKNQIEIRNFLGEKIVRTVPFEAGLEVKRTDATKVKDELTITGNDVDQVSQLAARVHQSCLVHHKDIRKFLDGIYVQTKCTASE
eukprot:PhM_4_TR763/c0_g1_i1/m.39612/K02940/RP-L9e, RPL9; large subunit ribosomal protein L9e